MVEGGNLPSFDEKESKCESSTLEAKLSVSAASFPIMITKGDSSFGAFVSRSSNALFFFVKESAREKEDCAISEMMRL